MKNKKFFAKALAFAMVMGTVGAHGVAARPTVMVEAAEVKAPTLTVDYKKFEATLTPDPTTDNNAEYVCLQVLKDAAGSKVSASYWYKVDSGTATVDLSFLKVSKAQYIRAYTVAGGEGDVVTVNAQPKTSIKYDAKAQQFTNKAKAVLDSAALGNLEYHPLYNGEDWAELSDLDPSVDAKKAKLEQLALTGTTIVVRSKADTTSADDKKAPAGTEVKLKISAVAKAPKVKVDYAKSLITIPKGAEVKLDTSTGDFTSVEGKLSPEDLLKKLSVADAKATMAAGFNLVVRTAAQTGKKPASNVDVVAIKAAAVLEATGSKTTLDSTNTSVTITDKSTKAKIVLTEKSASKGTFQVQYAKDSATGAVDSEFIYSTDEGKTWKKTGNATSATDFFTAAEGSTTKLLISVTPAEGTFAPEPIEVTFKAGTN